MSFLAKKLFHKQKPQPKFIGNVEVHSKSYLKDYVPKRDYVLGEGLSGKVLACFSLETHQKFAAKFLPDSKKSRSEIELQVMCSHPLVAKIQSIYANKIDGVAKLVVVMECIDGEDLFDRIRRRRDQPFTEQRVAELTHDILTVVAHLHGLNIAHRDIKPENILMTDRSDSAQMKLIDFGFAKACVGSQSLETPCYTPYYAAPEVLSDGRYGMSCDMWSVGVVVYIMMCGYPPFTRSKRQGRDPLSRGMKTRIKEGSFVFSAKDWSQVSQDGMDFIRSLLNPDAGKRISVQEALQHKWFLSAKTQTSPLLPEKVTRQTLEERHGTRLNLAKVQRLTGYIGNIDLLTLMKGMDIAEPLEEVLSRASSSGSSRSTTSKHAIASSSSTEDISSQRDSQSASPGSTGQQAQQLTFKSRTSSPSDDSVDSGAVMLKPLGLTSNALLKKRLSKAIPEATNLGLPTISSLFSPSAEHTADTPVDSAVTSDASASESSSIVSITGNSLRDVIIAPDTTSTATACSSDSGVSFTAALSTFAAKDDLFNLFAECQGILV